MNPAIEKAVADALPHTGGCFSRRGAYCNCGANGKRSVLIARISSATGGYVYLDRR